MWDKLSEEEKLEELRRKKLQELQQQAMQQQMQEERQQELESKKYNLMRKILSQEARLRLENIRMVRPQFAQQIELQLIQLYRSGRLKGATPLPDDQFKKILKQLNSQQQKKEFRIKK